MIYSCGYKNAFLKPVKRGWLPKNAIWGRGVHGRWYPALLKQTNFRSLNKQIFSIKQTHLVRCKVVYNYLNLNSLFVNLNFFFTFRLFIAVY